MPAGMTGGEWSGNDKGGQGEDNLLMDSMFTHTKQRGTLIVLKAEVLCFSYTG